MAGSAKTDDSRGLKQEIAGIVVLAAALYIGASLMSYNSEQNWGGVVGSFLSWGLLFTIGFTSYAFPFLLAAVGFALVLRRIFSFRTSVPVSFVFLIIAASSLLEIIMSAPGAGGLVGRTVSYYLAGYLGTPGALIVLGAVVVITVLIATGISFIRFVLGLFPRLFRGAGSAASGLRRWRAARAEGREGREREKAEKKAAGRRKTGRKNAEKARAKGPAIITTAQPKATERTKEQAAAKEGAELEFSAPRGTFKLPAARLLDPLPGKQSSVDRATLLEKSRVLETKLKDFDIEGRVLEVRPGPVVTTYEFEPAPGIKVGRITNLSNDLALAMKAMSIRIIAPIPGKSVVGIEVPNEEREEIRLREIIECPEFSGSESRLTLALGKDISGRPFVADLEQMPHLLVAGATGAGKSVSVNAMILSILFKATPEDVRFLMVDPKMLELSTYEGIPHLMTPVITDPKKAAGALRSIVAEMGKRYRLMADMGTKNIEKYNRVVDGVGKAGQAKAADNTDDGAGHKRLPYIVVIIDELADLMMTSGRDVEECLVRLSQMARAAGIHILVATQRPSVDVVTGLIKTNMPARIAFQLPSRTDSRTILDAAGAETLLGKGDMLFVPPGTNSLKRIHGVFVSEAEIKKITGFWKKQGGPVYDKEVLERASSTAPDPDTDLDAEFLERYREAVELASTLEMISTSYIQRRFRIGYNTAARLIEKMERDGIVGPAQGSRPREVLKKG